jgi:hypothetical protein
MADILPEPPPSTGDLKQNPQRESFAIHHLF